MPFCSLLIFLKILNVLKKFFQVYHQYVEQFGPKSSLRWVQTVCQGYEQMTLADKGMGCMGLLNPPIRKGLLDSIENLNMLCFCL